MWPNKSKVKRLYMHTEFSCEICKKTFPKSKQAHRKYCVSCSAQNCRKLNKIRYDKINANKILNKCKVCNVEIKDISKKTCTGCIEKEKDIRYIKSFLNRKPQPKPKDPKDYGYEIIGCRI